MALPKRRHSHSRTAKRRTHQKAVLPEIQAIQTAEGTKIIRRHHATEEGEFKGRILPGSAHKN